MANEAVKFYSHQFSQEEEGINFQLLYHVLKMINQVGDENLSQLPTLEEVKKEVFALDDSSAGGLDGLSSAFYHS